MKLRLAAVVLLALAAACGRGDDPTIDGGAPPTTSTTEAPTTTAGAPTSEPAAQPAFDGQPPFRGSAGRTRAYLADVRAAAQPGFDRVVFEFEEAVPGYTVDFTRRPVTEDGSGDEVQVEGATLLEVRMENAATARVQGDAVTRVYDGPDRVRGDTKLVTEAVDAGDFEGVVTWVVGLRGRPAAVRVTRLESPPRLVVDVRS